MSYQSIINDKKKEQRYNPYTKQIEYVSISQDVIDGIIADIQYNNNEINLLVAEVDTKADTTNIISQINLSTEWIKIQANKITLIWNTEFTTLSNTVDWKINTWWAASDINANVTTINWWKITTWSITALQIAANTITAWQIAAWTITTSQLNFTPVLWSSIISSINASTEWIKIQANKITLVWNTEFVALENEVDWKINTWWAASDINTNTTTINWWKITTWSITASQIQAWTITTDRLNFTPVTPWTWSNAVNSSGKVTSIDGSSITVSNINADNIVTWTLTWRTVQTASSWSRVVLDWATNRLRFYKSNWNEVAYMEALTINFNGANTDVVRVLSDTTANFAAQNWIIAWTWFLTTATSLLWHVNPIADNTYDLGSTTSYEWRNLRLAWILYIKWIPLAVSWTDLYWNWVKIN